MVETTDWRSKDFFHVGLTVLGVILAVAGVIIVSWRTVICGGLLIALGLAYFGLED